MEAMMMDFDAKRMDGADEWFRERKMSLHSLLNVEDSTNDNSPTVPMRTNGDAMIMASTPVPDEEQGEGLAARSVDAERYMFARDPALCDVDVASPYSSLVQRAICSICQGETGRCHASDPASMQAFFASSLGFDGGLSYADWLCMKCYSKWYNRCKRKATTTVLSSDVLPPIPTPPRRKRSTSSAKQHGTSPIVIESKEKEKDAERDAENDEVLLLTRMTNGNTTSSNPITIQRDLETEVDDLRDELHRVRGEVIRLSQELSRRDGQMEDMLKFVKAEIGAMHVLLKEIAEAKWKTQVAHHPGVNSNVISISPQPTVHVQAGSIVYIPPSLPDHCHSEWHPK